MSQIKHTETFPAHWPSGSVPGGNIPYEVPENSTQCYQINNHMKVQITDNNIQESAVNKTLCETGQNRNQNTLNSLNTENTDKFVSEFPYMNNVNNSKNNDTKSSHTNMSQSENNDNLIHASCSIGDNTRPQGNTVTSAQNADINKFEDNINSELWQQIVLIKKAHSDKKCDPSTCKYCDDDRKQSLTTTFTVPNDKYFNVLAGQYSNDITSSTQQLVNKQSGCSNAVNVDSGQIAVVDNDDSIVNTGRVTTTISASETPQDIEMDNIKVTDTNPGSPQKKDAEKPLDAKIDATSNEDLSLTPTALKLKQAEVSVFANLSTVNMQNHSIKAAKARNSQVKRAYVSTGQDKNDPPIAARTRSANLKGNAVSVENRPIFRKKNEKQSEKPRSAQIQCNNIKGKTLPSSTSNRAKQSEMQTAGGVSLNNSFQSLGKRTYISIVNKNNGLVPDCESDADIDDIISEADGVNEDNVNVTANKTADEEERSHRNASNPHRKKAEQEHQPERQQNPKGPPVHENKKRVPRQPPIMVTGAKSIKPRHICEQSAKGQFHIKETVTGTKIFAASPEAYDTIRKALDYHEVEYFSHSQPTESNFKVICKGLPEIDRLRSSKHLRLDTIFAH